MPENLVGILAWCPQRESNPSLFRCRSAGKGGAKKRYLVPMRGQVARFVDGAFTFSRQKACFGGGFPGSPGGYRSRFALAPNRFMTRALLRNAFTKPLMALHPRA
jgi:hypothetical protein